MVGKVNAGPHMAIGFCLPARGLGTLSFRDCIPIYFDESRDSWQWFASKHPMSIPCDSLIILVGWVEIRIDGWFMTDLPIEPSIYLLVAASSGYSTIEKHYFTMLECQT